MNNDDQFFIMDPKMKSQSGNTCFITKKQGIRYKVYLKFPQMLQSRKVRSDLGHRWYDWVGVSKGRITSKFMTSRAKSKNRGLTRFELSFKGLPTKDYMINEFSNFVSIIPAELSYATPHSAMWSAYADCLKHSLIVVDESDEKGLGVLIYSKNSMTNDLSGVKILNWNTHSHTYITRYTFSQNLPIHVIKLVSTGRHNGNEILQISGLIYSKRMNEDVADITFMLNSKGQFAYHKPELEINKLNEIGFSRHRNCNLVVSSQVMAVRSKRIATYCLKDELPLQINEYSFHSTDDLNKIAPMNYISHSISNGEFKIDELPLIKARNLVRGFYDIHAILLHPNTYPIIVINITRKLHKLYANADLKNAISLNSKIDFNKLSPNPIGKLIIYNQSKMSANCGSKKRKMHCEIKYYQ